MEIIWKVAVENGWLKQKFSQSILRKEVEKKYSSLLKWIRRNIPIKEKYLNDKFRIQSNVWCKNNHCEFYNLKKNKNKYLT